MGHHRFIRVNLAIEVADPATAPATTPDSRIKKGLKDSMKAFKPAIRGKKLNIRRVVEIR